MFPGEQKGDLLKCKHIWIEICSTIFEQRDWCNKCGGLRYTPQGPESPSGNISYRYPKCRINSITKKKTK